MLRFLRQNLAMLTMYQTFAALAKGEVITATSNGFGHAQARAEIMRYINHRAHPIIIFKEELIKTCAAGKASRLQGEAATTFDTEWSARFDELAGISEETSIKRISYSPTGEDLANQIILNTRVIKKLELELPVIASVEAQREAAREREEAARAAAKQKEYEQELKREDKRLVAQLKSRQSEIEQGRHVLAMDALRASEKELTAKNQRTLIASLPDTENLTGDLKKFIAAMQEKGALGKSMTKSDQELCELIVENIAPYLLKSRNEQSQGAKAPTRT